MLLGALQLVNWRSMQNTFGSSHATFVGAIVAWWNDLGQGHWSVDEAPTFGGHHPHGQGALRCDAVLCRGNSAFGVLEAEGNDYIKALERIQGYFADDGEVFRQLRLGIMLAYPPYEPRGAGELREYQPVPAEDILAGAKEITLAYGGKTLVVLVLRKHYERDVPPIRMNEFYRGKVVEATGYEITQGQLEYKCTFL